MKNKEIARSYLNDALSIEAEAQGALDKGEYHRAVRRSQETVELALKGLFLYLGVDYPPIHDVGEIVRDILPKRLAIGEDEAEKIAEISSRLAEERAPAFYGLRRELPARDLFSKERAEAAVRDAEFVINFVKEIVEE